MSCNDKSKDMPVVNLEFSLKKDSVDLSNIVKDVLDIQFRNDNNNTFIYILDSDNNIVIFDYEPGKISLYDKIKIPSFNFDTLNNTLAYLPLNNDSILIFSEKMDIEYNIYLLNTISMEINNLYSVDRNKVILYPDFSNSFTTYTYNKTTNSVFFYLSPNVSNSLTESPFLGEFSLADNTFNIIGITFPDEYRRYGFIPVSRSLYFSPYKNFITISFPFIESLYNYNINARTLDKKKAKTPMQNEILLYSAEDAANFPDLHNTSLVRSFFYTSIIWNNYDKHFYRFYELGQDEKNSDGDYNLYDDKEIGIVSYNEKFKYTGDILLGKRKDLMPYYKTVVPIPEGLLFFSSVTEKRYFNVTLLSINNE